MSPGLGSFVIYSKDGNSDSYSQEMLRISALGGITQCDVPSNHAVGAERQQERERRPRRAEPCWGWRKGTPRGATLGTPRGRRTKQRAGDRGRGQLVNEGRLSRSPGRPCPAERRESPPTGGPRRPSPGVAEPGPQVMTMSRANGRHAKPLSSGTSVAQRRVTGWFERSLRSQ